VTPPSPSDRAAGRRWRVRKKWGTRSRLSQPRVRASPPRPQFFLAAGGQEVGLDAGQFPERCGYTSAGLQTEKNLSFVDVGDGARFRERKAAFLVYWKYAGAGGCAPFGVLLPVPGAGDLPGGGEPGSGGGEPRQRRVFRARRPRSPGDESHQGRFRGAGGCGPTEHKPSSPAASIFRWRWG
jgi:hypothetical protein